MEETKKTIILETAIDLFRSKGYSAASMQDIAEACGMAKASIYKFYASKEDLFTASFVACHQTMLDQAAALDGDDIGTSLAPKEKLRRKIEFQLRYTIANHLFMIDFKELPIATNEHFIAVWKRKKAALHAWRRELLIEAYGERIEPYIWDVVAIFRGIHIEYLAYVQQKVIALPMAELAAFIVDRLDALVADLLRTKPKPILDAGNAQVNYLNPSDPAARRDTVRRLLEGMERIVRELPKPDDMRAELGRVVTMLGEECGREQANPTLIRVLDVYLNAVPELRPSLRHLRYLLGEPGEQEQNPPTK